MPVSTMCKSSDFEGAEKGQKGAENPNTFESKTKCESAETRINTGFLNTLAFSHFTS